MQSESGAEKVAVVLLVPRLNSSMWQVADETALSDERSLRLALFSAKRTENVGMAPRDPTNEQKTTIKQSEPKQFHHGGVSVQLSPAHAHHFAQQITVCVHAFLLASGANTSNLLEGSLDG